MPERASDPSADEILVRDREFRPHLAALGLTTAEEYRQWCAQNGFSQRLDKHWRDRCRERYFATQEAVQQRLARVKQQKRKPLPFLDRIFAGEVKEDELLQPKWLLVHRTLAGIADDAIRQAFHKLLQHAQSGSALVSAQPALARLNGEIDNSFIGGTRARLRQLLNPQRGPRPGNTFVEGLLAIARHHRNWIRPLGQWRPRSHRAPRQFSALVAHLLAKYPVPSFMDSAWFRGDSAEALQQQSWYVDLACGRSPRDLDLPISLRGQMARHFLSAPKEFFCEEAIRYGQVMGLGGDVRLVHTILGSRLGTNFDHNDFWVTVIRWLIRNPLLDPVQVSPLIDYIHEQRFGPQESVHVSDAAGCSRANLDFTMKGRTPESLLHQMGAWHVELRKEPPKSHLEWGKSGIGPLEFCEGIAASGNLRRWTIVELLSRRDLFQEGQAMRHCVASYAHSCALGRSSIWSLGVEKNGGKRRRALTIEVSSATRTICQVRGKANRPPSLKEIEVLRCWTAQEQLIVAEHIGK